ncbi:hypothetical protein OTU49_005032 [Cherax quadricarinatus]|uniref:Crustin 2 n=1 Tax=Cherax quadricarinatus TaxID=27406 RepID=A0AAW0X9Q8_CHEQU|nr:uncharacterized protein LOC128697441 [Cherax quadricarinatus]
MLRVCCMMMVLVAMAASHRPCLAPKYEVRGCINSCQAADKPGFFYCCDSKGTHKGTCPKVHLQKYERDVLCDVSQFNYPNHLNCKYDTDCEPWEKCCYLPDNNQLICRTALYN